MSGNPQPTDWHHAPKHVFVPNTTYMVTAGTLHRKHLFRGPERLKLLQNTLFRIMKQRGWRVRAWAIFSNHYHWIGVSPEEGSIRRLIQHVHAESAKLLNKLNATPGRKVWFQYWDKYLTFEKSYYARMNYVINNAVYHGLVQEASLYPFCSAGWMRKNTQPAFQKKITSFKYDQLQEPDEFHPVWSESGTEVPHSER